MIGTSTLEMELRMYLQMMIVFFTFLSIDTIWENFSLVLWEDLSLLESVREKVTTFNSHSIFQSHKETTKMAKIFQPLETMITFLFVNRSSFQLLNSSILILSLFQLDSTQLKEIH